MFKFVQYWKKEKACFFGKKYNVSQMDRSAVLFVIVLHARAGYARCLRMVILRSWKLLELSSFLGQSLCAWPWSWTLNCFGNRYALPTWLILKSKKVMHVCSFFTYLESGFSLWLCKNGERKLTLSINGFHESLLFLL